MNKINSKRNFNKIAFITCVVVLLVFLGSFIGVTIAWLSKTEENNGGVDIGEVSIQIVSGENVLNGSLNEDGEYVLGTPYEVTLGQKNTETPIELSIKNTGTIPGLVRLHLSVTLKQTPANADEHINPILIKTSDVSMLPNGWVNYYEMPEQEDVYSYDTYLNTKLNANNSFSVATSAIALTDDMVNKTIVFELRAEIIAYSGNAYQIDTPENPVPNQDKPFGNLSEEFLNIWTAWR